MINIVSNTLNLIELKGRNNIDRMLGCMMTLDQIKDILNDMSKQTEPQEEGDTDG